jgi:hypothetical protein
MPTDANLVGLSPAAVIHAGQSGGSTLRTGERGPPHTRKAGLSAVTYVQGVDCNDIRIILCMRFDPQASPSEVADFKAAVIDCPRTFYSVESAGAFDFMVEVAPMDMGSFNKWMKSIAEPAARLVQQLESSFVCKRFIRRPKDEYALWVPSADGLRRVDASLIDKVTADRDYVRVHSQGEAWMLHATMRSLLDQLGSTDFLQLHRSTIVRKTFIESLTHETRHWVAQLRDGSVERVARSHVREVLQLTRRTTRQSSVVDSGLKYRPGFECPPKIRG